MTPGSLRFTPASLAPNVLDLATRAESVTAVNVIPGGESTYDLNVEWPGTFFVMGILAEQKQIP